MKHEIFIEGDLNYAKVKQIHKEIPQDGKEIVIQFSCSKFVDSEGIKFLYSLYKEGKKIQIKNPPELFIEAVKILSLNELLDLVERS